MAKDSLKKIEKLAGLGKADLHIHLMKSSPEELLEYVQNKTDLNVIAITDHDSIENALKVKELSQGKKYRFDVVIGEEISSKEGHIVGLFLKKPVPPRLSARETLKQIKGQGGVSVAVHPFQKMRFAGLDMILMEGIGFKTLLVEGKYFDAIEVVNATPTLIDENLRASLLNKTVLLKAEVGSSDAHILDAIGKGYTVFKGKSAAALKRAILQRQTQAIYGKWTARAFLKYAFFFLPDGLRVGFYILFGGLRRSRKRKNKNNSR